MTPTSSASTTTQLATQSNLRALAQLFKYDVMDTFDAWNDERPLRTGFPHASNILAPEAEFCMRKLVLMATQPEQAQRLPRRPWDTHQNMIFKNGWMLHEKYQRLLYRYSSVAWHNGQPELDLTHFHEEYLVYFSPDVVQNHVGKTMPVEIKGYKASSFEKLDEAGPAPKLAHNQVNFYQHLMKLQHGLILVENKDTQDLKSWCVEYEAPRAQPYVDRLDAFKAAYQAGITPGRKCSKPGDRLAQKCEMCQFCFSQK